MKPSTHQHSLGFSLAVRKTRKAIFLDEMDRVVPWARLVDFIAPHCPPGYAGRPPFALESIETTSCSNSTTLVHTVRCTSGNEHDITQAHHLLHGHEKTVWADAGYQGVEKRPGIDESVTWHVAMRAGKRKALKTAGGAMGELLDKAEKLKAGVRAKVEHPFRVIKRQFGYIKTRYRGLKKSGAQIATLFALSNLWMARRDLMGVQA